MNLCELIRNKFNHDREFCLYPLRYHDGLCQACTVSYNRVTTIDLRFFNDKYEFQVWINTETQEIIYQPSGIKVKCFYLRDFIYELLNHSKEAGLLMIYSLFFRVRRLIEAAWAAWAAWAAAVEAAAAAADAAWAAAEAAADAAAAAWAARAAAAEAAADAARAAWAARDARDAWDARDARRSIRKALKSIFKYRRRNR